MSNIKTHEEMMARHIKELKVREKELVEQITSLHGSLAILREIIKKEEAAQKKDG